MSLWNSVRSAVLGVDLEAEQTAQDKIDANLKAINNERASLGYLTESQAALSNQRIDAGRANAVEEVNGAFVEGLKEGAQADLKFVKDTLPNGINSLLSGTLGSIFKSIPLSVWLLAGVGLFFWMGGATLLKGRLAKS